MSVPHPVPVITSSASASGTGLFRDEVTAARQSAHLGRVHLRLSASLRMGALLAMSFVVGAACVLLFATYTRKANASGVIQASQGVVRVLAPAAGTLIEAPVADGERIRAGQVLFVLAADQYSREGDTQAHLKAQLLRRRELLMAGRATADRALEAQVALAGRRLAAIDAEAAALAREIALVGQRLELATQSTERQRNLAASGFISAAQVQQSEGERLAAAAELEALRRTAAGLTKERLDARAQSDSAERAHRVERANSENAEALLSQEEAELAARASFVVKAPIRGELTGRTSAPGQRVGVGSVLGTLIPQDADMIAQLFVTPRQVGFVRPGQAVRIRYAAFPFQKFGQARGTVESISQSAYAREELPLHAGAPIQPTMSGEGLFLVRVRLEHDAVRIQGIRHPLKPGMTLEADIVQDSRRLYEWMLEPLFGAKEKLGADGL